MTTPISNSRSDRNEPDNDRDRAQTPTPPGTSEPRCAGFSGSSMSACRRSEVALAAAALAELRHGKRNTGIETLKRLIRRG
jgi:hypothetical protein